MSIWGKVVGGMGGFALGGPIGALLGALGGHMVDRHLRQLQPDETASPGVRSVAFTIAVVALGAKMAKADGLVSQVEIDTFKRLFRIPEAEMKNVARVFDQARQDAGGFEPYARQVAGLFRGEPQILQELLWCLTEIARADGRVHLAELQYLRDVAAIFGFDAAAFARITGLDPHGQQMDDYALLGVSPQADNAAIKAAHRKMVLEHHPDKLVAKGMPPEFVETANRKLAEINAAYDRIRKERGLS